MLLRPSTSWESFREEKLKPTTVSNAQVSITCFLHPSRSETVAWAEPMETSSFAEHHGDKTIQMVVAATEAAFYFIVDTVSIRRFELAELDSVSCPYVVAAAFG